MASTYPASVDAWATNKQDDTDAASGTDLGLSTSVGDHATHHNDLADAVNKIEATLGPAPLKYFPVPSGSDDTAELESRIAAGEKDIHLRSGNYSISAITGLVGKSNVRIRGVGVESTKLSFTSTTGTVFDMTNSAFCEVSGMTIAGANKKTAGALFYLDHGAGICQSNTFRDLWILSGYRAWELEDTNQTLIEDVQIGDAVNSWGWDSAFKVTGASVSVAINGVRGGTGNLMASAFLYLNHGSIDTFRCRTWDLYNYRVLSTGDKVNTSPTISNVAHPLAFRNGMRITGTGIPAGTNITSGGGTSTLTLSQNCTQTLNGSDLSASDGMNGIVVNGGTWIKLDSVNTESGTLPAISVAGGVEVQITNSTLMGNPCLLTTAGSGIKLTGGNCVSSVTHGIQIAGGTDVNISGVDIHDIGNGFGGSSGWNGIDVSANVGDFNIINNTIGRAFIGVTQPLYGVRVQAGTSNNYRIRGNKCVNYTGTTPTGVLDLGTGVTKDVGGNTGLLTSGFDSGLKLPVRAASVGNLTLTAPGATIDGVTMVAGDRFLAKDQTAGAANGIYTWTGAATTATRTSDSDTAAKFSDSVLVNVDEGAFNADTGWSLSTAKPITLGTTILRFIREDPPYAFPSRDPWSSAGNEIAATMDRVNVGAGVAQTAITAICSFHGGMVVPAGRLLTNINAFCTAAGAGAVTLFWWALVRQSDRVVLQRTANSTTLPTINVLHTRALQAAITLDHDTPCYIALATQVATTSPAFEGANGLATSNFYAPIITGNSSTTPTSTPPTVGAVLGAPAAGNVGRIRAFLS